MRRDIRIGLSALTVLVLGWIQGQAIVLPRASIQDLKDNPAPAIPTTVWDHKCMWVLDTMPITFGCDRSILLGCSGKCSVGVLADDYAFLCVPASNSVCSGKLTKVVVLKYYEGRCQSDCSCTDGEYLPSPIKVEIVAYECR